jgi:hypothetical protein
VHALSATVDAIEKAYLRGDFVIAVFLDIKGAFDCIKPSAIIAALRRQGVPDNIIKWFQNYLNNRTCKCSIGDTIVTALLTLGTPQGSILSPPCG